MKSIEQRFADLGIGFKDILIPKKGEDLEKWAVVACDQYTSQKDYWERVKKTVGNAPSTLNLIFPECYLHDGDEEVRIEKINQTMKKYVDEGVFQTFKNTFFLTKRKSKSGTRWGLVLPLDLEKYSWEKGAKSLVRPTEQTIMSRIPPRKKIRKDAVLEFPHIIILISDPEKKVIEPLKTKKLEEVYDFDLMENGGHLSGWAINKEKDLESIADGLENLMNSFTTDDKMLYAMGDGNHSLATAKSCWEDLKKNIKKEDWDKQNARYALVEIENIFDDGIVFAPIHRVFFDLTLEDFEQRLLTTCESFDKKENITLEEIEKAIYKKGSHCLGVCTSNGFSLYSLKNPKLSIPAGSIQSVIDSFKDGKEHMDYIHGMDVLKDLATKEGNIGVILPSIPKDTFFESILKDGVLPRKTFSLGEADEKRYYMEGAVLTR